MNYTIPDADKQFKINDLVPELPTLTKLPKMLSRYINWVCWVYEPLPEGILTRRTVSEPASLAEAYKRCMENDLGLGFQLTALDPFTVITIAPCRDDDGNLSPDAIDIARITQTYNVEDKKMGELYIIAYAEGFAWDVCKNGVRMASDQFVFPLTPHDIGAYPDIQERTKQFETIARRYCAQSWMDRVKALEGQGDENTVLHRVLTECLDTPGWLQDAEATELYPFLGLCWHSPEMAQKVIQRMHAQKEPYQSISNVDKIAKLHMPRQEKKSKHSTVDDIEISTNDLASMLHYDAKGYKVNEEFYNISMILQNHDEWRGRFRFDAFQNNVILDDKYPLSDSMEYRVTEWFGKHYQFGGNSSSTFLKGIHAAATMSTYDPLKDYISNLPEWDGVPRLETWMIDMCGSPNNGLSKWTAYMTIMQMVARAMTPGCMARNVPVWEGEENKGKTRMIKLLGDPWSITFDMSMDSKEAHMAIQGVWVAELAELDTLRKTTETRLKSFVSQTQDTFVPKYSNNRASYPRRTVFFGTTNDEDYLTSVTGNTRWFPISTGTFNYKRLEREREQLFAEAMYTFRENPDVAWWEEPCNIQIMLKAARDQRRTFNPYEESLSLWLDGNTTPPGNRRNQTCWKEIATEFLKLETPKEWKDKLLQMQVTSALKALGWNKGRDEYTTFWKRPESQPTHQTQTSETPNRSEYDDSGMLYRGESEESGLPF